MTISDVVYGPLKNEDSDEERASSPLVCVDKEFIANQGVVQVFQGASSLSSYINLTNTIVGSGMLGLPYAVAKSGWVLGLSLLVISGLATIFSLHLLTICASKVSPPSSFYAITEASMPRFTFLIDFAVFLQTFGAAAAYLIVIGGLMPDVMQQIGLDGVWQQRHVWVMLGFAIVAPLSCLRNLDALKYTSAMAVAFVFFLTIIVLLFAANVPGMNPCADEEDTHNCAGETHLAVVTLDTFRVFSIFIFAFSCQTNIFSVVNELRHPTQRRYDNIIWASIITAAIIYATVAAGGYITYGADVDSNVLMNYPRLTITSVARVFVSALVAFSYPLQCHPGRSSLLALWRTFDENDAISEKYDQSRFMLITAAFLGLTLGLALVIDNLGIMLSIVGATGATMIAYILPGASYYMMHRDRGPAWKRIGALLLCGAGLIIMPACLIFTFI